MFVFSLCSVCTVSEKYCGWILAFIFKLHVKVFIERSYQGIYFPSANHSSCFQCYCTKLFILEVHNQGDQDLPYIYFHSQSVFQLVEARKVLVLSQTEIHPWAETHHKAPALFKFHLNP